MAILTDFTATDAGGRTRPLTDYDGHVALIVNTASRCGFATQYAGLEQLWQTYRRDGLVVLGFPCNQFGQQEPGDSLAIAQTCSRTHGVTFPMFAKVDVNGGCAHPLFRWLRREKRGLLGGRISWNFTKFLVGRDGQVIRRYGPGIRPDQIAADIERALDG